MMNYRKKTPENEGNFYTYNNTNRSVIKPRKIINELKKSDVGRETIEYLEREQVKVNLYSGVDNEEGIFGYYDPVDDEIGVFCDKCGSRREMAKTVIHEAMHRKLGAQQTFDEEVECFCTDYMHDHKELTPAAREDIIKMVREKYDFEE